jgi:YidC/Oxa1 family membrane protein insertase
MNIFTIILTQPLANGLILFYDLFGHNLGVAILLFSSFLFLITRPLSKPQIESLKKIRAIQPQIDKLKKKYRNDRLKFSQAQAELYKQNKINPSTGCIFQILQLVILVTFYQVFASSLSNNAASISKLNTLLYRPLKISQGATLNTEFLYLDVSKPDTFNVPGIPFALPGVFLILAILAQFLSAKIMVPYISEEEKLAKTTKSQTDDMQLAVQQSTMYFVPLMTLYFGYKFPSGLVLYWLIFSLGNVWMQVSINGWGSLTPLIQRLGLVKSTNNKKNKKIK